MSDLSRGQVVTLSPSGITAEVLYVRGDRVRVRNVNSGKERTVGIARVTPKRESGDQVDALIRAIGGADA